MSKGLQRANPKDRVVKTGQMLTRVGFVLALLLGLSLMFELGARQHVLAGHLIAGVLVLGGIWAVALRYASLKRSGMGPLWAGAGLAGVGAVLGLLALRGEGSSGLVHLTVMLLAVSAAEMGAGRLARQG